MTTQGVAARATKAHRDLTNGSIVRWLATLSAPAAVEMTITQSAQLIDTYWLGQVGGIGLAAAAIGSTLRMVLISPMMGLSMGGLAVVARHVGERDQRGADYAVMQSLLLVFLFTIPLMAIGLVFGRPFLQWMGASDELLESSLIYFSTLFLGLFFTEALPTMSAVIRGAGHPEYTLRINILSTTTMLILDPLLVLGSGEIVRRLSGLVGPFADPFVALTGAPLPAMGVKGAAITAIVSAAVGVLAQFVILISGKAGVYFRLSAVRPDFPMMGRILKVALPTAAQRLSLNLAGALLIRLVTGLGTEVLTGYSVVTRLSLVMQGTISGVGMATATMVGQNLGGKRVDRAVRSTWLGLQGSALCSLIIYGLASLTPVWLITRFSHAPGAVAVGVEGLRYFVAAGLFLGWPTTLGSALGGAGDAVSPMIANVGSLWLLQLPICWLLISDRYGLGSQGVWISLAVGYLVGAVGLMWWWRKGRWQTIKL